MPSSDWNRPKRSRRLWWLAGLLLAAFALYSAAWFWAAGRVRTEAGAALAALDAKGIRAECAGLTVSGYPLSFALGCRSLAYQDDDRAVAATAGRLDAAASLLHPLSPGARLTGPLRVIAPGIVPLWIDWDRLHATTALSWPLPRSVTLTAEGLSGQTDPEDGDPEELFNAAAAEAELRPVGGDLDYRGRFSGLEIAAGAIGGRTVPPLDGMAEVVLKNGIALLRAGTAKSLRGQAVEIGKLDLSSGEAGVSLSGPIAVDTDGLIDASLRIELRNPRAVGAILAAALPEKKKQIEQGFSALAMLGEAPMTLNVVKGRAALGFIPLGRIDPLP